MPSTHQTSNGAAAIRVVVVDRLRLLSETLKAVCSPFGRLTVVGTGTRAEQVPQLIEMFDPQVAVLDAVFCDEPMGQTLLHLRARNTRLQIVLLDDAVHDMHVRAALRLGAAGYWTKQESFTEIVDRIERVAAGETVYCPEVANRLVNDADGPRLTTPVGTGQFQALTAREFELLPHLARGLTVKQVAGLLNISPSTVDNHKSRIMKKLNIHKAAELTRIAIREGIITT